MINLGFFLRFFCELGPRLVWVIVREYITSHSGQLSLLSGTGNEHRHWAVAVLCGWEGNRRSGVAMVMCHRLCGSVAYERDMTWTPHLGLYSCKECDILYLPAGGHFIDVNATNRSLVLSWVYFNIYRSKQCLS